MSDDTRVRLLTQAARLAVQAEKERDPSERRDLEQQALALLRAAYRDGIED